MNRQQCIGKKRGMTRNDFLVIRQCKKLVAIKRTDETKNLKQFI